MPLFEYDPERGDFSRPVFRDRLVAGRITPIISDEALADLVLGGYNRLVQSYADAVAYPMPDRNDLAKIAKYHQMRRGLRERDLRYDYLNFVKGYIHRQAQAAGVDRDYLAEAEAQVDEVTVSEFGRLLGYPRLDRGADDPLLNLANLPFPIYLTTSPYTFVEDALRRAGKEPLTDICRWRRDLMDTIPAAIPAAYQPSAGAPLVYHLFGLDRYAESLALTEDDFFEFLRGVTEGRGRDGIDPVHALVRRALVSDLLILGFNPESWPYRALDNGLIKPSGRTDIQNARIVMRIPDSEAERNYLQESMQRAGLQIYWGSVEQFLVEDLRRELTGPSGEEAAEERPRSQPQPKATQEKTAAPKPKSQPRQKMAKDAKAAEAPAAEAAAATPPTPAAGPRVWLYMAEGKDKAQIDLLASADRATWGANEHTQARDLVLIYRTAPYSDIAYLFRAANDPQPSSRIQIFRRNYAIDLGEKITLSRPVTLAELRAHPRLADWNLARSPQGAMRETVDIRGRGYWDALRGLLVAWNPACAEPLAAWEEITAQELLAEALTAADEIPDESARGKALTGLTATLTGEMRDTALNKILTIKNEAALAEALITVAPLLTGELLDKALDAAVAIQSGSRRSQALVALAPRLAGELLDRALAAAAAIRNESARGDALVALAPRLEGELLGKALDAAASIQGGHARSQVLAALAPRLTRELLDRGLTLATGITDRRNQTQAVAAIEQARAALPLDFTDLIAAATQDFTGREWALAAVDRWLADPQGPRFFIITGEPGSGKTALAARLAQGHAAAVHHFCVAGRPETTDSAAFVRSVITQLINTLPGYDLGLPPSDGPAIEVNQEIGQLKAGGRVVGVEIGMLDLAAPLPRMEIHQEIGSMESGASVQPFHVRNVRLPDAPLAETFQRFVVEPLARQATSLASPVLIVVDGLEFAVTVATPPCILDLITEAAVLPPQVRFVVTTRPDPHVLARLEPQTALTLALDPLAAENLDDIRAFVQHRVHTSEALQKWLVSQNWTLEVFLPDVERAKGGNFGRTADLLAAVERGEPIALPLTPTWFPYLSAAVIEALCWAGGWSKHAGSAEIFSEYVLAGLYMTQDDLTVSLLTLFDDDAVIRSQLEELINQMTETELTLAITRPVEHIEIAALSWSARASQALKDAHAAATNTGANVILPRHLLGGLLGVSESWAGSFVAERLSIPQEQLAELVLAPSSDAQLIEKIRQASPRTIRAWHPRLTTSTQRALRYAEAIRQAAGQSDPALTTAQVLAGLYLVRGEEAETLLRATLEDPAARLAGLSGVTSLTAVRPVADDIQPPQLTGDVAAVLASAADIADRKQNEHIRARYVLGSLLAAPADPATTWLSQATGQPAAVLARVVDRMPEREELTVAWVRSALRQETELLYDIQLELPDGPVVAGDAFSVIVRRLPAGKGGAGSRGLAVPAAAATGGNLGLVLNPSGIQVIGRHITSLPLDPEAVEPAARFTARSTRPGATAIQVELHLEAGGIPSLVDWRDKLEGEVTITGAAAAAPAAAMRARPVSQPDLCLQVVTHWSPNLLRVAYRYRLDSHRTDLALGAETDFSTDDLPSGWLARGRRLLGLTMEGTAGATGQDVSLRLASLGYHLYRTILPANLQASLRGAGGAGRSLLIICDQDAWLPWGLLHDGSGFLAERFILGLWPHEIDDMRPYEFPLGRVTLASFEPAGTAAPWADLLAPPTLPQYQPEILERGLDLRRAEAVRGLHVLQTSAAGRGDTALPVLAHDIAAGAAAAQAERAEAIGGGKLNLRRNRPLVGLSYLGQDRPAGISLAERLGRAYLNAGCSAFVGPLWAVDPAVEAAFVSTFYAALWGGARLGQAFQASRRMARLSVPDSLDWLAYTLFGDPMARPYLPEKGDGYAVVEPVGREMEDVLAPGQSARFRVMLQRKPPVWNDDRIIEVAEAFSFERPQARIVAPDLVVTPGAAVELFRTPEGEYLGWFTLAAPAGLDLDETLVQVFFMDGTRIVHTLMFPLTLRENGTQP